MPRSARKHCESNIYHIFIRGVGRQLVFEDDQDREMFLEQMSRFLRGECRLLAWVLMDNHVHLLIRGSMEAISLFMQKVESSYSGYFNKRHDRVGYLFQGRFGSEGIADDRQLLAALRYIHQNPVKGGLSRSCDYRWSSYGEYLRRRGRTSGLCDVSFANGAFDDVTQFERFHTEEEHAPLLDVESCHHRYERMSDAQATRIASQALGEGWKAALANCVKAERDERIRSLKSVGLSIRQIERLTGIGRGIIQRS